jgi:hypothetical protein
MTGWITCEDDTVQVDCCHCGGGVGIVAVYLLP